MLRKPEYSDFEKMFWAFSGIVIPSNLRGSTVSSLDDLRVLLPSVEGLSEINEVNRVRDYSFEGYVIYGRTDVDSGKKLPVGYSCKTCNKIIVDEPGFEDFNETGLLAGSKGYTVICKKCKSPLAKVDVIRS